MTMGRVLSNWTDALKHWAYYRWGNLRAGLCGVRVGPGARVSPHARLGGAHSVGSASIGRDVVMGEGSYVGSGQVMSARIGRWCSLGYDVLIGPAEHDPDAATTSPVLARARGLPASAAERDRPPPVIGDEVWIGARAIVLRGVTIGDGAVVGAGAVVTRDIPPREVWAGVPARRLRERKPA
jgi:acetyltransferase-like isoleucine patch superfamily enzyme